MAITLRSDHVNYLIWRYLQEYGYGRTAVQLMRDWGHSDPQDLPFAPSVGPHALLSVLQDGFMYDELLSGAEDQDRRYSFINEQKRKTSPAPELSSRSPPNESDIFRKRTRLDAGAQAPRSGVTLSRSQHQDKEADDMMDVDRDEEQTPPRIESTLILGQSIGVQSEKPSELKRAKTLQEIEVSSSSAVHIHWDSVDSSRFIVAGDSVCRLWTVPHERILSESKEEPAFEDLMSAHSKGPYLITAISKPLNGNSLALVFEEGEFFSFESSRLLLTHPGDEEKLICKVLEPILVLRWHPSASLLLGLSMNQNGGLIAIWNAEDGSLLYTQTTATVMLDAAWCHDMTLMTCGRNVLEFYNVSDGLNLSHTVRSDNTWEKIKFDEERNLIACSTASDGQLGLCTLEDFKLSTHIAHDDQITSLEWQPLSTNNKEQVLMRRLATASVDGTIKIWNIFDITKPLHVLCIGSGVPVMVATFSPNGELIAAAGDRKVVVWKAERGGRPVASWTSLDRLVNGHINGEADNLQPQEFLHNALSWNCDGTSLAYGIEDKVSVIGISSASG